MLSWQSGAPGSHLQVSALPGLSADTPPGQLVGLRSPSAHCLLHLLSIPLPPSPPTAPSTLPAHPVTLALLP